LSTSAERDTAYGHIHEIASASASRRRAPCGAVAPRRSRHVRPPDFSDERAVRDAPDEARSNADSRSTADLGFPRCGRGATPGRLPEAKDSQPFWAFCELPSFPLSRASLRHQLAATEAWSASAAPRAVRRAKFPWRRGAAFGNTGWPRLSFQRLPAKDDAFPKTRVLSTDRRRASGGSPLRPRRSVSPPRRPPLMGWGIANRETSAFFTAFPSASP